MSVNTLSRAEKLKSPERISAVAARRQSFSVYPLRAAYLCREENPGETRVAFTVSKRYFKHAVDRNRIKRLMREAYRLHKGLLREKAGNLPLDILFIYSSSSLPSYRQMEEVMIRLLEKLSSGIRNLPKP